MSFKALPRFELSEAKPGHPIRDSRPVRVGVADYCTRPELNLTPVMDGLQAINRCRDVLVTRLQLQGEELRVMARLVQIATVEP
jgi:hypothetical protein